MLTPPTFRVLVVDDDDDIRALLKRALESVGLGCAVARDGVMAENMLRVGDYDCVITDIRMPRKHGHKLVVEILEKPNPPVVFVMTGLVEVKIMADLLARGVADVMQKPLRYDLVAVRVKIFLERRAAESQYLKMDPRSSVAEQINQATTLLRAQLSVVQESFQQTISSLEQQKEDLEEGFIGSLRIFSNLVGPSGRAAGSHAGRVEAMSEWIARSVGLDGAEIRDVKYAALLHDLGQFGMPDAVRRKPPEALTPEEREAFRSYPLIGSTLLSEIRGVGEVVKLVEAHRENFDGSGFPQGKRGVEIPLGARIIRLADECDTFSHLGAEERSFEACCEFLRMRRGIDFDPTLVEHAIAYLNHLRHQDTEVRTTILPVAELEPGMALAENVYDAAGHFLARQGAQLSPSLLTHLRQLLAGQSIKVYLKETAKPAPPDAESVTAL